MTKRERYKGVINWFLENAPVAESELDFRNQWELLVAVILSAQCTDKRVNIVTPPLFERYPNAKAMSQSDEAEIYSYISSVSYPNSKAKNLFKMSQQLVDNFSSDVPSTTVELETLAGVGRKTANVVASVWFDTPAMAVDTHVFRVSERIGLTYKARNPLESERQLVEGFPRKYLARAHHWLILHGRYICKARSPMCDKCGLTTWCKKFQKKQ